MTLIEAVEQLPELNVESTIYAALPWTAGSETVVIPEPEAGVPPSGLKYFLEVAIAREVLESLANASSEYRCSRLIAYAMNDA